MSGYLINLDSLDSLKLYIENGVYATKISPPTRGYWTPSHEGTFADYATMHAGDNIYFFIKRKIYGIGELVNLNGDCKFVNFPEASWPRDFEYEKKKRYLLWDEGDFSINQRWLCVFKPSPHFFIQGIDMDDVLSSNPSAFKMLRVFWGVSFIKFDDEENQAFKDIILKLNQDALKTPERKINVYYSNFTTTRNRILEKMQSSDYRLTIVPILESCAEETYLRHEMALEAGILYQLACKEKTAVDIFGEWDYLTHQVISSPFKPVDYMDKMDIFGYSYITGFSPTRSKYLVAEIKKDSATNTDVDQLLKYVDWIKNEYCYGDYSMINAFLVAFDFNKEIIDYKNNTAKRNYTVGMKPAMSLEWNNLNLVKYSFDFSSKKLFFEIIA